jgi:succinylarginine dihydrolase
MWLLHQLGVPQAVLPPQERPQIQLLRAVGFSGTDAEVLAQVQTHAPHLLSACSSAAAMWTANAATVCPSTDSADGLVHITPANLCSHLHRAIEPSATTAALRAIFADPTHFVVHDPLPANDYFADEGAANHTSFTFSDAEPGLQLFVYGRNARDRQALPSKYPARQTLEASQAIARLHRLSTDRVVFAQQSPEAIDAGVFHNDVISVGHRNFFLYHEKAFVNTPAIIQILQDQTSTFACHPLICHEVSNSVLHLQEAVRTYLFNSQLVTLPNGEMALIAPKEVENSPQAQQAITQLLEAHTPITKVHYVELLQSMQNGGGPACLRLRVLLTPEEEHAMHQGTVLTEQLYRQLQEWIKRHYRDRLTPNDLADPHLLQECRQALEELSELLQLTANA